MEFKIGDRVTSSERNQTGAVVFNKAVHSVTAYNGYILVKLDQDFGWNPRSQGRILVPAGADHLLGLTNLLWIHPMYLSLEERSDGYEIDA